MNVFKNIKELKQFLRQKYKGKKVYYRGQVFPWDMESSFHRLNETDKLKYFSENNEIIKAIKASDLDWFENDNVYNKWYGLFQQYGRKTDLIDFTTNIDVAEFFALNGKEDKEIGCIYVLEQIHINQISDFLCYVKEDLFKYQIMHDEFIGNSYSPLFNIHDIKEELRVFNQEGYFLWDYKGVVTQFIHKTNSIAKYKFYHTDVKSILSKEHIYPKQDIMESIM
jgi:hypothetical protein